MNLILVDVRPDATTSLTGSAPNPRVVRIIAQEAGGVSGNSNNFDGELARIEDDAGAYYLLVRP